MFTRKVGRAFTLATLIAVATAPLVIWAGESGTGSSRSNPADAATGKMPASPAAMMKMKPHDIFTMMDQDRKGYVTKEEFLRFQEQLFNAWDKDKIGRLPEPVFTDEG